jgi:hypothetical protein
MPNEFQTYLRRQRLQLEWIAREKGEALLVWCSRKIGTWDDVRAHVAFSRDRIELSFDTPGGRLLRLVRALERTTEGARVVLAGARGRGTEALDIVWKGAGKPVAPPGDHLDLARSWLRRHRPGAGILSCSRRSDRAHSLSRFFLRVHARFRQRDCLVLVAPVGPNRDRTPDMLTQALIWTRILANGGRLRSTPTAVLLAPWEQSAELYNRVRCIDRARARIELWEYQPCGREWRLRKAPPPPLPVEHRDYRWPVMGPFRWSQMLADVMDLAPADIRRHPRFCEFDSLRLRGLEFARAEGPARDCVTFGVGPQRTELTAHNFDQLRELVESILYYRRPDSPDPHHKYYQLQSERWLESLMLDDMTGLFPELAPGSVYSQIPVYLGSAQGRVDILGADADGTLLIMELKVTEDAGLPLQALDYWGRVIRHNLSGDFGRRGYFSEVRLNRQRPRVYLISPVFSFHDTTESVLDFVSPGVEVWKISINTDWRCGVKILNRTRVQRSSRTGSR